MRLSFALAATFLVLIAAPATASALKPCADLDGWDCGSIEVPIDRSQPALGTADVTFAVRPRDDAARPSKGTIMITDAPYAATITEFGASFFPFTIGGLAARRDLVLVDVRGTGADALNCPDYQHGTGPFSVTVPKCAAQLGAARDFYTYGDLADDMDAVRAKLGVAKVDLYATGHATPVIEAYAIRHPERVRTVVMDSATDYALWPDEDLSNAVHATALVCKRSPRCSAEIRDPEREVAWLAQRLRQRPLTGVGHDAVGKPQRVRLGEAELAYLLLFDKRGLRTQAELPAAARALRHGDPVPMLRLAAVHDLTLPNVPADVGDPAMESVASLNAAYCAQWPFAWDRSASPEQRLLQFNAARATLPPAFFAPFSLEAAMAIHPDEQCRFWPAPARENPILPPGRAYPDVAVLALGGDLNTDHPALHGERVAQRFPNGRFVKIPQAGQSAVGWSRCAGRIFERFVNTLSTGPTRCSTAERAVVHGVGSYPLRGRGFAPAKVDRARDDRSRLADRRIATAAVHTYLDAVQNALDRGGEPTGRGLRGGNYRVEFGDAGATFTLDRLRLAKDVHVSGTAFFGFSEPNSGELRVSGPGSDDGTIDLGHDHVFDPTSPRIRVTGRIGGRPLSLLVTVH